MTLLKAWRETSLRFSSNRTFWRLTGPYIQVLQLVCSWCWYRGAAPFKAQPLHRYYYVVWQPIFAHISMFVLVSSPQHHPQHIQMLLYVVTFLFSSLCCQMTSSWWGAAWGRWSSRWWTPTPALTASLPQTLSSTARESQSKERSVREPWASGLVHSEAYYQEELLMRQHGGNVHNHSLLSFCRLRCTIIVFKS